AVEHGLRKIEWEQRGGQVLSALPLNHRVLPVKLRRGEHHLVPGRKVSISERNCSADGGAPAAAATSAVTLLDRLLCQRAGLLGRASRHQGWRLCRLDADASAGRGAILGRRRRTGRNRRVRGNRAHLERGGLRL